MVGMNSMNSSTTKDEAKQLFAASDDSVMMKQIHATHAPDGRELYAKPLLHIVEDIFLRAAAMSTFVQQQGAHQAQLKELDEKVLQNGFHEMIDTMSYNKINKISYEISSKCSEGGEEDHATTLAIFNLLSNYSWDAKVVLALAAFAVNYGEFSLVAQIYLTNPLAKAVALLKQLPEIIERAEDLKPQFEALTNLIRAMTDVAKCIVELKELPSQYITPDTPEMLTATAHIPTAVYWIIRSIVACTSQIVALVGMGHEYTASTTETWELSSLAHKVSNIHSHLKKQLALCYQHIDEKRNIEAYLALVRQLDSVHIDNMRILKALIYAKDDQLPLIHGSTKKGSILFRLNCLKSLPMANETYSSSLSHSILDSKGKQFLQDEDCAATDSDLELSNDELTQLKQIYSEAREQPGRAEIVDRSTPWDETKRKQFETLQPMMPWYSVHHPSLMHVAVIRYIKEMWHFNKKALIVVLDPQGKVVNPNAIHMVWIWRSLAFPFTSSREEALWNEETWKMKLLVDGIDQLILSSINEGKLICLYGGEDIEWIRKFTEAAKAVAISAGIHIEMVYVGRATPENVRKINSTIFKEELSHVFSSLHLIWFFWVRLESMWHSKVQHKRAADNDPIMQEVMTMLSFDGSGQGWAVISKGSDEMAKARGDTILKSFADFESWKQSARRFLPALIDHLHLLHSPTHCNRLILPEATGSIPERIVCAECNRPMEKFIISGVKFVFAFRLLIGMCIVAVLVINEYIQSQHFKYAVSSHQKGDAMAPKMVTSCPFSRSRGFRTARAAYSNIQKCPTGVYNDFRLCYLSLGAALLLTR
uniref:Sieve element occlusion N-terminal domain-containing protein n=1 Tax=Salix viminalis TaxID=40686 RepID=A0A6N2L7D7_SALVM